MLKLTLLIISILFLIVGVEESKDIKFDILEKEINKRYNNIENKKEQVKPAQFIMLAIYFLLSFNIVNIFGKILCILIIFYMIIIRLIRLNKKIEKIFLNTVYKYTIRLSFFSAILYFILVICSCLNLF